MNRGLATMVALVTGVGLVMFGCATARDRGAAPQALEAFRPVDLHGGWWIDTVNRPYAVADGYVAAARAAPHCSGRPQRLVRSGPNKYALGRCATADRRGFRSLPRPRRRLLPEAAFASVIADDTCVTVACRSAARASGGAWVLVAGRVGVRPRTIARCPRYKNIDFATDHAVPEDRLARVIPKGEQVIWRYATRGGRWVMVRWGHGSAYGWAFVPRRCVADPPTWSEIAVWSHNGVDAGRPRPTAGARFRVLRPALRCPSRLRCVATPAHPHG